MPTARCSWTLAIPLALGPIATCHAVAPGYSLIALNSFGGNGDAIPRGVSGDGNFAVGHSSDTSQPYQAFRWTASGGLSNLGTLGAGYNSEAWGASADGSVIVGQSGPSPFRWTASTGMTSLGIFPPGAVHGTLARATNADGSVAVGYGSSGNSNGDGNRAFRWTTTDGFQDLGVFPGAQQSSAIATSADGSVVVGYSGSWSSTIRPFRWTKTGGMQDLGNLPGHSVGYATGVSADGSTVLGYSGASSNITLAGHQIFLWTAAAGKQVLPSLPNTINAYATAISGDGSTVLGINNTSTRGNRLMIWNRQGGVFDLVDLLIASGVDTSGWSLGNFDPAGLSFDGRTIVGDGYYSNGSRSGPQGFVATIGPIPTPGTGAALLALTACAMKRRRRV